MEAEQRSDISIVATVRGCPFPTLTWSKAPAHQPEQRAEVSYDEHINKVVSDDSCTLLVQQANRADTGLYTLTAANSVGRASAEMRLNVLGLPDRPSAPIKFESIGSERITLSWLPPKDDGGSKITNYVIWRRVASRSTWVIVTNEPKERVWTVENLMAGHEYIFRIMAQNKFGVGEPLDSEPEVARDLYAPPGQVEKPKVSGVTLDAMTISDWTKSSVDLHWIPPLKDGGSKIIGYWVESKEEGTEAWVKVGHCPDGVHALQTPMPIVETETCFCLQAKETEIRGTRLVIAGLKTGGKYKFRVTAFNAAGNGEPGEVPEVLEVNDRTIAPEVDLDASMKERMVVHAGGVIRIIAYVSGQPAPEVTWTRDGATLPLEAVVETTGISSSLVIKPCTRKHLGVYTLTAKNAGGEKTKNITVEVLDVPGPVGIPFSAENLSSESCKLSWFFPENDGGSPISNYIVEKREAERKAWTAVSFTASRQNAVAQGLTTGKSYFFRVAAENAIGLGPFMCTAAEILIKEPMSVPDRPEELEVTKVSKDLISVTWKAPKFDGGSEIIMYMLEARMIGKDKFSRLTKDALMERKFTFDGLREGDTFEFRVIAVNEVGPSKPSFGTKPITCKDELEPPTIELDFRDAIVIRVGESCLLQGRYSGKPSPSILWYREDEELKADKHVMFKNTLTTMSLGLMKAERRHSGRYVVVVENSTGSRKGVCNITVVDRPTPPVGPVVFEEVHREFMVISWKAPLDSGGVDVSNYIIEQRDTNREAWTTVTSANTKTFCKIPKLTEGREYIMRISAENMYGISDPLESEEMRAKDLFRVPEAPEMPTVREVYATNALVLWTRPRDGGKPITNYILEKKEPAAKRWSRVTREPLYPATQYRVQDLVEGCEYEFRVMAENELGTGDPSVPSKPVLAKDPIVCPSPPVTPESHDKTKDSVSLRWKMPRHDGKGRIFGYLVEYQSPGGVEWLPANETPEQCPDLHYVVTGLEDGKEYNFRIFTVNAAGKSDPAFVKTSVKVHDRMEEPELLLDANMARDHLAMLGSDITLSATIKGVPTPTVSWKKDDGDVPAHITVAVTASGSKVFIPKSIRADSGNYTLTAENAVGKKSITVAVLVLNKPSPPRDLVISEITSESAYLTWKAPEDNGGAVISHYVVEKKDVASDQWVPVSASNKKPSLMALYLMEGIQYLFRVAAENQFGKSAYVMTRTPIKALDPLYPPGPPKNLHHTDADKTEVWLAWEWPERTGGSEITGFIVEHQEDGQTDWVPYKTVSDNHAHVTTLMEGKTYRFRVKSQNAIGVSRPDTTVPITCQEKTLPPTIEVDVKLIEGLVVKAGTPIALPAKMSGIPTPTAKWMSDDKEVVSEGRFNIETVGCSTILSIPQTQRGDTGEYLLTVANPSGSKTVALHLTVLDLPGPPISPINILEVTPDYMMIQWRAPKDDGGTPITNYVVEKKDVKKPWEPCAENKIGAGPAIESKEPVLAVDPIEKPGEPIDFHIAEIGKDFCFLKWKKPDYDGGSRNIAYHVEKKPKEAEEWERLHKGAIKETYFMADRCIENQLYQFRVQTKNEGGESNWVTTPEVLVKEQLVEPEVKIKLDATLVVKAGDSIHIEAIVKGKPQPVIKWNKDEETREIRKGLRHSLDSGTDFSKLLITASRRTDSGTYLVTVSNSAGTASAHAKVNVLDRPGPVMDLKVSGITTDRCHLSWEVPEDDGGCEIYNYIIEKCETKRGVWSVHSNAIITNQAKVTRLVEGNEYIFRVRAENKMGPGPAEESEAIVAGTQFSVPDAPEAPEITKIGKHEMTVEWAEPEKDGGKSITGYLLEKREEHAVRWSPVVKEPIPSTRYTVTGLLPLHDYQYRVKAVNEIGVGSASKPSLAITAKDTVEPPAPPTSLKVVDSTKSSVSLSWTKPVSDGGAPIIGYVVELRLHGSAKKGDDGWKRCNVAAQLVVCEFTVYSLEQKNLYVFRVSAQNQVGMSLPCELEAPVIPKEILEAPEAELDANLKQGLTVRAGCPIRLCATVRGRPPPTVSWRRMGLDNVTRKGKVDIIDTMTFLIIPDSTRNDSGKYCLSVRSPAGEKALFVNVKVLDTPGPVMDLEATDIKQTSASLSWSPPEMDGGSEITHYVVEKREIDRKTWAMVKAEVEKDKVPFKVSGLVPGTEYYFRVTAVNEYGPGVHRVSAASYVASDPVSKPDPCEKIEVLEITKNSAMVGWVKPARDGGAKIDGYVIEYIEVKPPPEPPAPVEVAEGEEAPPSPPPVEEDEDEEPEKEVWSAYTTVKGLSISISGLKESKKYRFRVAAKNVMGQSSFTETREAVEIKEQILEPKIVMPETVTARAGAKLRVEALVSGKPSPTCQWMCGEDAVVPSSRLAVHKSGNMCVLIIKDVSRTDSGEYSLVAENISAKVVESMKIIIRDIPGPPEGPVVISDIDADACSLAWNKPLEDGGSSITNYVVEKCDLGRGDWVTATSSGGQKTSCRLGKLIPGKDYAFRIRAENRFGMSDPMQSERMVAKFPFDVPSEPLDCRINKCNKDCMFVAWDKPETDGGSPITGYYIERKERNSLLWVKANDCVVRSNEYPCAGLIEGLEYTFRVSAINRAGQGKPSKKTDFVTARTPIDTPGKPEVLDVTKNSVVLVWTRPKNDGGSKIIGYYVEMLRLPGDMWLRCNTSSQNCPREEYTVTGLERDLQYQFRVIAKTTVNVSKTSEPSDPVLVCAENGER
ncbi:hypothetical protein CesoFtcFv8_013347 [Champsocephalus esox]|uniref:Titin n=1 Tax=Champsocephalus esox TaxID=159716 RepID=A0AAN8GRY3_9TELE|nr:hypothetical protein CesoFtcFv8_013347 [Champsocephalus esox]